MSRSDQIERYERASVEGSHIVLADPFRYPETCLQDPHSRKGGGHRSREGGKIIRADEWDTSESALSKVAVGRQNAKGIPDMRAIRQLPILDVSKELRLCFGSNGLIHCWHPDKHEHGDRTASVSVCRGQNKIKCFGCNSRLMGPLDLVADVLEKTPEDAALWIAAHFPVPLIAPRKHITEPPRIIHRAGFETALGLPILSGVWANLSPSTQRLIPVLLELGDYRATATSDEKDRVKSFPLSYRAMSRYTGSKAGEMSPSAISKALVELEEIGWIRRATRTTRGPLRKVGEYTLTPFSDTVWEHVNTVAGDFRATIKAEKELRKAKRTKRINAIARVASKKNEGWREANDARDITKYNSLSSGSSVRRDDASTGVA